MFRYFIAGIALSLVTAVSGQDIKVKKYDVIPGNYFKHYGARLDRDLVTSADGTVSRKKLLFDGKLDYAPQTGICYVFWRVKPEECFISFHLELEKETEIGSIEIYGSNLSGIYGVAKASAEISEDEITFEKAGEVSADEAANAKRLWKLMIPCKRKAAFVKVTVWTAENKYLNITEIKITGKK